MVGRPQPGGGDGIDDVSAGASPVATVELKQRALQVYLGLGRVVRL